MGTKQWSVWLFAVGVWILLGRSHCTYPDPPVFMQAGGEGEPGVTLQVHLEGNASEDEVQVVSDPEGIQCGGGDTLCQASFAQYTTVILQAIPRTSSVRFTAWGGACGGDRVRCSVVMDTSLVVRARFDTVPGLGEYLLQVSVQGSGWVTSVPQGIHCGVDCSETFAENTQVSLEATPSAGYRFQEWRGACSGSSPSCVLTVAGNLSVIAVFAEQPPLIEDHFDVHPVASGGWVYGPRRANGSYVSVSFSFVYPSAFGSIASGWGGVEILHDLNQPIDVGQDNFELAMYLRGTCSADADDDIIVDLSLLDASNSRLVTLFWGNRDRGGDYTGVWSGDFDMGGAVMIHPGGQYVSYQGGNLAEPQGVLVLRKREGIYRLIYEGTELVSMSAAGGGQAARIRLAFFTWYNSVPCSVRVDWVRLKQLP